MDPSQGQFFLWVKVYFCLSFSSLIMLLFWQHLFPNISQQVFFLLEIDVVSQNCKTQNTLLTPRVIPEQSMHLTFSETLIPDSLSFFSQSTSICNWQTFWYKRSHSIFYFSASLYFTSEKASGADSSNCFFQLLSWFE